VNDRHDDRSPFAVAMEWSARLTTISMELVLPALGGYWLDQRLGTRVLFLILGVMLGFVAATLSLVRLTKPPGQGPPQQSE
jgi:F0F1-type ATP synthase assembly protein I